MLCRYTAEQLQTMFDPASAVNRNRSGARECSVCHASAEELTAYSDQEAPEIQACPTCRGLFRFGEQLLQADVLVVQEAKAGDILRLPGWKRELSVRVVPVDQARAAGRTAVRVYVKNAPPEQAASAMLPRASDAAANRVFILGNPFAGQSDFLAARLSCAKLCRTYIPPTKRAAEVPCCHAGGP